VACSVACAPNCCVAATPWSLRRESASSVQFLHYAQKVFRLNKLLRGVRDGRSYPEIPTRALLVSLLMGVVLRVGSYLDLAEQTKRRRWQHLIHWTQRISHDSFEYVTERLNLEDLRQSLATAAKELKANKALESCKINGLLFTSLDANEHFHSRSRCCPCCCQREIEVLDAHGQKQTLIEYYHRYVFAQINGPKINVLLDLEPIRPGEAEAEAALRLLGRMRRVYGVRFFDAVTIDAWYVQGPFLKAVKKLGWMWEVVLKQERMEVFEEARQLREGKKPDQTFRDKTRDRNVQLWAVKDLSFTQSYGRPVWVVYSEERWTEKKISPKVSNLQATPQRKLRLCPERHQFRPGSSYRFDSGRKLGSATQQRWASPSARILRLEFSVARHVGATPTGRLRGLRKP